jgi:hypothetical protein
MSNHKAIEGLVDTLCRLGLIKSGIIRFFLDVDLKLYFRFRRVNNEQEDIT